MKFRLKVALLIMVSFYVGCMVTFLFMSVESGTSINNAKYVVSSDSAKNTKENVIAFVILSSPSNFNRRKAIRETWLTLRHFNKGTKNLPEGMQLDMKFYFVIGTEDLDETIAHDIQIESKKYKDILLLKNFKDDYKYLTRKVLLAFKWILDNVLNIKYIFKCDDDTFVRLDLLPRELYKILENQIDSKLIQPQIPITKDSQYQKYIYWGYFYGNARVYETGRWSDTSWFLCDRYLPYALGGGYLLSIDIVKHIVSNMNVLRFYKSEDVSVGAWTAGFDINRIHDKRFDTQWTSRGCDNTYLVRHKQSIKDMQGAYSNLLRSNFTKMCAEEKLQRNPYNYNWNILPSQCCVP